MRGVGVGVDVSDVIHLLRALAAGPQTTAEVAVATGRSRASVRASLGAMAPERRRRDRLVCFAGARGGAQAYALTDAGRQRLTELLVKAEKGAPLVTRPDLDAMRARALTDGPGNPPGRCLDCGELLDGEGCEASPPRPLAAVSVRARPRGAPRLRGGDGGGARWEGEALTAPCHADPCPRHILRPSAGDCGPLDAATIEVLREHASHVRAHPQGSDAAMQARAVLALAAQIKRFVASLGKGAPY